MTKLSDVKYCIEIENGAEPYETSIIIDKYICDMGISMGDINSGDKAVKVTIHEWGYDVGKIYLWHKILVNEMLKKGYEKVIVETIYDSMEEFVYTKEYTEPIKFPADIVVSGDYCKNCVKRVECTEVKNTVSGILDIGSITSDAQLYQTYMMFGSRKNMIEDIEKELKKKLSEHMVEAKGIIVMPEIGAELVEKKTEKDSIKYSEAKDISEIMNDDCVSMKVTEIKKKIKGNVELSKKISFKKVPFQTSWDLRTTGSGGLTKK